MKRFLLRSDDIILGDKTSPITTTSTLPVIPGGWLAEKTSDAFIVMNEAKFKQYPELPTALSMLKGQIPIGFMITKGPFLFADIASMTSVFVDDTTREKTYPGSWGTAGSHAYVKFTSDFTVHGIKGDDNLYYGFIIKFKTAEQVDDLDDDNDEEDEDGVEDTAD